MSYCVFEDLKGTTEVKIHLQSCGFFTGSSTTTTRWYMAKDLDTAIRIARDISRQYEKGWRKAQCCLR